MRKPWSERRSERRGKQSKCERCVLLSTPNPVSDLPHPDTPRSMRSRRGRLPFFQKPPLENKKGAVRACMHRKRLACSWNFFYLNHKHR